MRLPSAINNGTVSADSVTVWSPGTIGGSGLIQATNGMMVEGTLAPEQTLSINGVLSLLARNTHLYRRAVD